MLEELARNAPAREEAVARPSSGKETDLPAAATRMKMTTPMKRDDAMKGSWSGAVDERRPSLEVDHCDAPNLTVH